MQIGPSDRFVHEPEFLAQLGKSQHSDPACAEALRLVETTQVPQRWLEEGAQQPSLPCRKLAKAVLIELFSTLRMLPQRVNASRVGGVMLAYRDDKSARELEVEIDNELDVVAVISTEQDVLDSAALESPDEWRQFARKFQSAA